MFVFGVFCVSIPCFLYVPLKIKKLTNCAIFSNNTMQLRNCVLSVFFQETRFPGTGKQHQDNIKPNTNKKNQNPQTSKHNHFYQSRLYPTGSQTQKKRRDGWMVGCFKNTK